MRILPPAESNSKYPHFYILIAAFFLLSSLTFAQYHVVFSLSPTAWLMHLLTSGCPQLACNDLCCGTMLTKGNLLSRSHMFYTHGSTGHGIATLLLESCCARLLSPVSSASPERSACCSVNEQSQELQQLRDLQREEQPHQYVNFLSISSIPKEEKVGTTQCPSRKLPPSQPAMPSKSNELTPVIHAGRGAGISQRSMQAFENHCSVISTKHKHQNIYRSAEL